MQKPHPTSKHPHSEWRFSFSVAERILINNWNNKQKYVYHILRMVQTLIFSMVCFDDEKQTFLRTYYFKTIMLWIAEEMPQTFWDETSIEKLVDHILLRMIEWITARSFPHYFINGNNLMDHVNVTQIEIEIIDDCRISAVHRIVTRDSFSSKTFNSLPLETINFIVLELFKICFDTMVTDLQSCLTVSLVFPSVVGLFQLSFIKPLHAVLLNHLHSMSDVLVDGKIGSGLRISSEYEELQTKCSFENSIAPHLKGIRQRFESAMIEFFLDSLKNITSNNFKLSASSDFHQYMISSLSLPFKTHAQSIAKKLVSSFDSFALENRYRSPASKRGYGEIQNTSITTIIHEKLVIEIFEMRFELAFAQWIVILAEHFRQTFIPRYCPVYLSDIFGNIMKTFSTGIHHSRGDHFQETKHNKSSQSVLDELDNCWWYYVHCASQTNFEFTVSCDYGQVEIETQDILRSNINKQIWNRMHGHGVFYVQLKVTWSQIFDQNIQCVLGFVALVNSVTKRDVVNGWIRVCPILFLHYLRIPEFENAEQTNLQCSSTDGRTY